MRFHALAKEEAELLEKANAISHLKDEARIECFQRLGTAMILSPGETDVLNYVRNHPKYTVKDIAAFLRVKPRTVKFQLAGIRAKLGVVERNGLRRYTAFQPAI